MTTQNAKTQKTDAYQSLIKRERVRGQWIAYEPAGHRNVVGRGASQFAAVKDYVEKLEGGQ